MKNNKNTLVSSGGIGFTGLLQVVFITLKLIGIISWSWVWVLSPIWITTIIMVIMGILIYIFTYLLTK